MSTLRPLVTVALAVSLSITNAAPLPCRPLTFPASRAMTMQALALTGLMAVHCEDRPLKAAVERQVGSPLPAFSLQQRDEGLRASLEQVLDYAVFGGGGAGISAALTLATIAQREHRPIRIAVFERRGIASGASTHNSRWGHAGIRYLFRSMATLRQFLDSLFPLLKNMGFVFREMMELPRLHAMAPHLTPLNTFRYVVLKMDAVIPFWMVRWGTRAIYDNMAVLVALVTRSPYPKRSRRLSRDEWEGSGLDPDQVAGVMEYYVDRRLSPRFTIGLAQRATERGVWVIPYAEVTADPITLPTDREPGSFTIQETLHPNGLRHGIRARHFIDATGYGIDGLRHQAGLRGELVNPRQGSFLLLRRSAALRHQPATVFFTHEQGKTIVPIDTFGSLLRVGPTDVALSRDADGRPRITEAEIADLMRQFFRAYPGERSSADEETAIRDYLRDYFAGAYTGVRPIARPNTATAGTDASRDFRITTEQGMTSLAGAKMTAMRALGVRAAKIIPKPWLPFWKRVWYRVKGVAVGPIPGGERLVSDGGYLESAYGTLAERIRRLADEFPELAEPVLAPEPWIFAEIVHMVRHEMALTLSDVLFIHTDWGYLWKLPDPVIRRIATTMAAHLPGSWSAEETERQIAIFYHEWQIRHQLAGRFA